MTEPRRARHAVCSVHGPAARRARCAASGVDTAATPTCCCQKSTRTSTEKKSGRTATCAAGCTATSRLCKYHCISSKRNGNPKRRSVAANSWVKSRTSTTAAACQCESSWRAPTSRRDPCRTRIWRAAYLNRERRSRGHHALSSRAKRQRSEAQYRQKKPCKHFPVQKQVEEEEYAQNAARS